MADANNAILSSDEVERLLTSFHDGQLEVEQVEAEEGLVKYYDFKRPNTISREKKRLLFKLYETTAYHISRDISNYLRASVKVGLDSIDELSFGIFKNTCPELLYINSVRLKPMHGFGCITLDLGLCISMVEKAFGGTGKSQTEIKKLTDIESTIIGTVVSIILDKLKSAWDPFVAVEWRTSETSMESRYLNIASDAEVLLVVSFNVNLEYSFGELKFCVPVSSMDYTLEKFVNSSKPHSSPQEKGIIKENRELLDNLVKDLNMEVTGVLDETNISIDELISLKEGDIMKLERKVTDNMKIVVEGKDKFYGKLGLIGSKKAIQITSPIDNLTNK